MLKMQWPLWHGLSVHHLQWISRRVSSTEKGGDALIFIDEVLHIDLETGENASFFLFAFLLNSRPPLFVIQVKHECSALNSTSHKHFTFITSLQDRQSK